MKSLIVATLALATLSVGTAEDDGQYHPYKWDYHKPEARYYTPTELPFLANRNGKYDSIHSAYQPFYKALQPASDILVPHVKYGDHGQELTATSAPVTVPVTHRSVYAPTTTSLPTKPLVITPYHNNYSQLKNEFDLDTKARTYHFAYQTANGIAAEESGTNHGVNRVSGFYEYIGTNGHKYRVDYTADEFGFHPRGAHLPV